MVKLDDSEKCPSYYKKYATLQHHPVWSNCSKMLRLVLMIMSFPDSPCSEAHAPNYVDDIPSTSNTDVLR